MIDLLLFYVREYSRAKVIKINLEVCQNVPIFVSMKKGNGLYNAKQAAKVLRVSRSTFYRMKRAGVIEPKVMGKTKRYRASDVLKLLTK